MSEAAPAQTQSTTKYGHTLTIATSGTGAHNVYLDRHLMYRDTEDMMVLPAGAYQAGRTTYFLVSDVGGGSLCPSEYRVVIAGKRNLVTKSFGTCSDIPTVSTSGSKLLVTMPKMNGSGKTIYAVSSTGNVAPQHVGRQYVDGTYPNGQDLTALLSGKPSYAAFQLKASSEKLRSVLGPAEYKTISTYVISPPFKQVGNYLIGKVCQQNFCGSTNTVLVFDHKGNAWVRTAINNVNRWFGDPSPAVVAAAAVIPH